MYTLPYLLTIASIAIFTTAAPEFRAEISLPDGQNAADLVQEACKTPFGAMIPLCEAMSTVTALPPPPTPPSTPPPPPPPETMATPIAGNDPAPPLPPCDPTIPDAQRIVYVIRVEPHSGPAYHALLPANNVFQQPSCETFESANVALHFAERNTQCAVGEKAFDLELAGNTNDFYALKHVHFELQCDK